MLWYGVFVNTTTLTPRPPTVRPTYHIACQRSLHSRVLQHRRVGHCAYLSSRRRCPKGIAQCPSEVSSSDLEDSMQRGRVDDAILVQRLQQSHTRQAASESSETHMPVAGR